jgi:hypothetical protein
MGRAKNWVVNSNAIQDELKKWITDAQASLDNPANATSPADLRTALQNAIKAGQTLIDGISATNQTDEFNAKYGMNIDFRTESMNPDFVAILKNGSSVEAAYRAVHFDEMMGGAMFKTAQAVTEKMANNLQAKASRPVENGISSRATATVKTDVNSLTRKDREEIERRVARGERISF